LVAQLKVASRSDQLDQKAKYGSSIANSIDKLSKNPGIVTCAFTFCVQMPLATQEHIFIVVKNLFCCCSVLDDGDFQFKFTRMKTAATGPGAADTLLRAP